MRTREKIKWRSERTNDGRWEEMNSIILILSVMKETEEHQTQVKSFRCIIFVVRMLSIKLAVFAKMWEHVRMRSEYLNVLYRSTSYSWITISCFTSFSLLINHFHKKKISAAMHARYIRIISFTLFGNKNAYRIRFSFQFKRIFVCFLTFHCPLSHCSFIRFAPLTHECREFLAHKMRKFIFATEKQKRQIKEWNEKKKRKKIP